VTLVKTSGGKTCGLYYKPMTIVNDDSRVINKLEASLTDDARVIIYDHHMFIVQATVSKILVVLVAPYFKFTSSGCEA
jgi:hypothetical protein